MNNFIENFVFVCLNAHFILIIILLMNCLSEFQTGCKQVSCMIFVHFDLYMNVCPSPKLFSKLCDKTFDMEIKICQEI